MISDGLAVAGENNEFLMECMDDDPQTFAKNIIKKFNNKRDDDITIMICRIQKTKK